MRTYRQLTQAQRYQIYALQKTKHTLTEIATVIGVHKSSVSRELKRNRGQRGYRPQQAHELAAERKAKAVPRITAAVWKRVESLLKQDWSPEQISGRLKKEQRLRISHEWIYQHILVDKQRAVSCTSTCVARRNGANVTEPMIDGANCPIAARLRSVQPM